MATYHAYVQYIIILVNVNTFDTNHPFIFQRRPRVTFTF